MEYSKLKSLLRQMILVPMAISGALAILLLWETFDLNRSLQSVNHTDQILDQSGHLLALLVDMESATRGYIATGDENFLQPYQEGTKRLDSEYQALYELVDGNLPQQQQRLKQFHIGYVEWEGYASGIITLRRAGKADPTLYENQQGKRRMDLLRGQILEFQNVEAGLRIERVQAAHLRWTAMVTSFLGLGLGVGSLSGPVHALPRRKDGGQAVAERGAMDGDLGQYWRGGHCNRQRGSRYLSQSGRRRYSPDGNRKRR